MIAKASGRLLRLVNSLLDFASVESGRLNITFRPTKLSVYIEDIASLFRTAFEREGIQYNVIIEDCGEVYTDISCLEKVVYNLLSNALKYTPAGSVTVKCFLEDDTFILEVADTGIGLSEEDARKIFDRFYRSAAQSSRSIEGSGIGLALARDLTRLLRGSLSVKSTLSSEEQA
jgi:signal transduction histidine kinase